MRINSFNARIFAAMFSCVALVGSAAHATSPDDLAGASQVTQSNTSRLGRTPNAAIKFDRTTCFVPAGKDSSKSGADTVRQNRSSGPASVTPDQAWGAVANLGDQDVGEMSAAWANYMLLWRAQNQNPDDPVIRRYLGLTVGDAARRSNHMMEIKRGRSAPQWLQWSPGSFAQISTSHFTIQSRAGREVSLAIANDLEKCYWIWTQMFFPLWEGSLQVRSHLRGVTSSGLTGQAIGTTNESEPDAPVNAVVSHLKARSSRLSSRKRLRVVVFRDFDEYVQTLGPDMPGIRQSTGFYSDQRQTMFLFASANDQTETRRHELTHQLFREATRSQLGRNSPGQQRDFWLVEGVAGYMESIWMRSDNSGDSAGSAGSNGRATVGGWDSPRMQFARYRVLANQDLLPLADLRSDGQLAAQSRADLPRWYAHAINHTHRLMDSGNLDARRWIYAKLADLYEVSIDWRAFGWEGETDVSDLEQPTVQEFLRVTDRHLKQNPVERELKQLCLSRCQVTSEGLASLPKSNSIEWLDLTGQSVSVDALEKLVDAPESLARLSLEATPIDDGIANWISQAIRINEIDLSWTRVSDQVVEIISGDNVDVLWLTGTGVSDRGLERIVKYPNLQSLDVQRSEVTEDGLKEFASKRSEVSLNPLKLVEADTGAIR